MNEVRALGRNDLEIAVLAALEIALNHAAGARGLMGDDLAADPARAHVPIVAPIMHEIVSLQDKGLEIAAGSADFTLEVALYDAACIRGRGGRNHDQGWRSDVGAGARNHKRREDGHQRPNPQDNIPR